jgi:hypothetical protein
LLSPDQRQTYIEIIRKCPHQLAELVDGLSPEQLSTPYANGEWTVAQNIHHLLDAHMNSYLRLKLILTSDRPLMQIIDQDAFAAFSDSTEPDVEYSLMALKGLHHRWVSTWEQLSDQDWIRVGLVRGTKEITPDYLLENYAHHCLNHIEQIEKTLAVGGIDLSGSPE